MSRIHQIVEKAERDGLLTRTRAVAEAPPPARPAPLDWRTRADREEAPAPAISRTPHEAAPPKPAATPALEIDPMLVVAVQPSSSAAEQYRLLRTRIAARDKLPGGRRVQVVLVTSPRNGDGKTVTSTNLALSMAQEFQQRVLLVDADLRRPAVGALFDLPAGPGLADVLLGTAALEDALVPAPGQHLTVLPAGEPPARPGELAGSTAMRHAIETLRSQYDRIVIDTPPIALADTHVLASLADGVLVVVRAGVTPRPAVERALAAFDRDKVLGLVLNEVEEAVDGYTRAERSHPISAD